MKAYSGLKTYSIVRRLIVVILLVELAAGLTVTTLSLARERHVQFWAFDVMLRGGADSLLGAVQDADDAGDNVMLDGTEASLPKESVYLVMDEHGRELGRSGNWSEAAAEAAAAEGARAKFRIAAGAYFETTVNGRLYRAVRVEGVRRIDPGSAGGGTPKRVTVVYGARVDRVWHRIRESVEFYGLMSLAVMVVTGLLMAWLLRRGLAPLGELAAEAGTVSVRSWEFAPSGKVMATRELRPLARAMGDVLEGLKASFVQRDRFVSDAAHELKTGVAVVKSSLQLLTMRERTAEEYRAGLERAEVDCARMEAIVGKMLLLARMEQEEGRQRAGAAADAGRVALAVADELAPMAEAREVSVVVEAEDAVMVALDAEELRLVCANLAQNAIQHSGPGAQVRMVVRRLEAEVELRIEDRGRGIGADDLPHVFERFYRGDPSRSRSTGGTGLGLAISKAIVSHAGGTIKIESVAGEGTVVTVRLPAAV